MKKFITAFITTLLIFLILYHWGFIINYILVLTLDLTSILLPFSVLLTIILSLYYLKNKQNKVRSILQVLYTTIFLDFIYLHLANLSTWILTKDPILWSKIPLTLLALILIYLTVIRKKYFPLLPLIVITLYVVINYALLIKG